MSAITTHILDTSRGKPAAGVDVTLSKWTDGVWQSLGSGATNEDGRANDLIPKGTLTAGVHRIRFETGAYFIKIGAPHFYPYIPIIFEILDPGQHHHVPLLLNPYGYSTYRGS